MRRKSRASKGISPLIAAVLLIAFTVAIATLVAGWFSTLTRTTTAGVTNKTNQAVDCSSASINIKEVYVLTNGTSATANIKALVENNGFIDDMNITSAFAHNKTGNAVIGNGTPISDFDRGEQVVIQFNTTNSIAISSCPADFDRVVVTTDCGGVSDIFNSVPKCGGTVP